MRNAIIIGARDLAAVRIVREKEEKLSVLRITTDYI